MKLRNACRLQVERLEQREVPAGPALTGTHPLTGSFMLQVVSAPFVSISGLSGSGTVVIDGHISSGLLKNASVSFNGSVTGNPSPSVFDFAGVLIFNVPKKGVVITTDTGNVDISQLTFQDNGTILGGSGQFRGTTGSFSTIGGTVNILNESVSGSLSGIIMGKAVHHHHHP